MKVTAFELQLWEKLLLKHKLLTKPQIDASIAAWRAQPATSTLTLAQMFEKQGVKPNHTRQLADHIKQAHALAHQQALQKQAPKQPAPAAVAPPHATPAPGPAAAPNPSITPAIPDISDADLSIEGLDLTPPASPTTSVETTSNPSTTSVPNKPLRKDDPVLAPKFAGNDDLMPNESEDVRWTPSEAEWVDEIKTDGAKKSDIPQIDLSEEADDPNQPRRKIFKQDDAKEWYGAIGGILNSTGAGKSNDIPILDVGDSLEEPSKSPENKPKIIHNIPSIGPLATKPANPSEPKKH
jgi:hypothetical protein